MTVLAGAHPVPRVVVFLHAMPTRSVPRRGQHLARHFADHLPVIYVPYRSPSEWLFGDGRRPEWGPLAAHPNIRHVPMPMTVFLSRRSRLAAAFHARVAARGIRRALAGLGVAPEEALFFIELATAAAVADHFPGAPVMYDSADDARNWHGNSARMRRLYGEMEDRIAKRASWIVLSIPRLEERFRGVAAERISGINCVDTGFISSTEWGEHGLDPHAEPPVPEDLAAAPGPRLIYVGAVSAYIDADLVAALADARIGSVVLVGPVDPRAPIARLKGRPNLFFLGARPYETLPAYLRGADVALIPATGSEASDCLPAKLLMYCAAGLPVVARRCDSLGRYEECLLLADDAPGFVRQVRQALREPAWQREARIDLARANTWPALAARLLSRTGVPIAGPCAGARDGVPEPTAP